MAKTSVGSIRRPEDVILEAVAKNEFAIDELGRIFRIRKRRPVRAEHRTSCGYLQIRKMIDGKRYCTGAHRVVWEYFNNQKIPKGLIINHINGQKDDNRPENLELSTYSENIHHAHKHGLLDQFGQKNPAAKITDKQVAEIRLAYSTGGFTQKELGEKYGVSFQAISKIARGERRTKQPGTTGNYKHLRQRSVVQDPKTGRFMSAGRLLDGVEYNEYPEVQNG